MDSEANNSPNDERLYEKDAVPREQEANQAHNGEEKPGSPIKGETVSTNVGINRTSASPDEVRVELPPDPDAHRLAFLVT